MTRLEYFGTNFIQAGHFFWDITEGVFDNKSRHEHLPFDPDYLVRGKIGESCYYQSKEYTAIGFVGSPYDKRPGCSSVFVVKKRLSREEMLNVIWKNSLAVKIIERIGLINGISEIKLFEYGSN